MDASSFEKPDEWRKTTIDFIRTSALCSQGRLRCSYVEMLGLSGRVMFERMRALLSNPQMFIGIERDAAIFFEARREAERRREGFQIVYGNFYHYCSQLADVEAVKPLPAAAIFNADETKQTSHADWWINCWPQLGQALDRAVSGYGEGLVIVNCSLDRPSAASSQSPSLQLRAFVDHLVRFGCGSRRLDRATLFAGTADEVSRADDGLYGRDRPQWVGGFQIYCSSRRRQRMATARLRFDRANVRVYKEGR